MARALVRGIPPDCHSGAAFDDCQRRFQLVGRIGGEPLLEFQQQSLFLKSIVQTPQHAVEGDGKFGKFVAAGNGQAA